MDKRLTSIEVLKGLGIIYLIGLHEWVWFFLDLPTTQLRYKEMEGIFPLFGYYGLHVFGFEVPLLAGITYFLVLNKKKPSFQTVLKRALTLIGLGYLVNFMCWGVSGLPSWDVLHFIGLSMILSYPFLRYLPQGINLLGPLAMGIAALALSNKFPWPHFAHSYVYALMIGDTGGEHFWPFCPWYFVFAMGLLAGYIFVQNKPFFLNGMLALGVTFFVSALWTKAFHPVVTTELWGKAMFKPSPFYVVGIAGMSMMMIWALERLFKTNPVIKMMAERSFVVLMGRSILWLYLLNTIAGYHVTFKILSNYDLNFTQAVWAYLGVVLGTLLTAYIIAFAVNQKRTVEYA